MIHVALAVVVSHAVFALLCYTKTDLVSSICSDIADGTAYAFDMVTVPMEGIVLVILLPAGICELCNSAQMSLPKD